MKARESHSPRPLVWHMAFRCQWV